MGTSALENGIYGISGLWDLGIMGFVICGILVLWEKEGEEGRNRERRIGQEPWSISPFQVRVSVFAGDKGWAAQPLFKRAQDAIIARDEVAQVVDEC